MRRAFKLLASALSIFALCGCRSAERSAGDKLVFWPPPNRFDIAMSRLLVDRWNKEHPEIQVEMQPLPAGRSSEEVLLAAIRALPPHVSGPAKQLNMELSEEIESLRLASDDHRVLGGGNAGAVIVSQVDEPVDFARLLANRVANLVPVDDLETPIRAVNAYTQTIGIYPESIKLKIRSILRWL